MSRDEQRPAEARVAIRLLGGFEVTVDGARVPDDAWRRRHAAALVKALALAPDRRLHREQVIDALWPDLAVDEAAPRLHKAAHYARKALGADDSVVLRDEQVALWPGEDPVVVDVVEFERQARRSLDADTPEGSAGVSSDLYGGDLLPGDPYEPWTIDRREQLRALHVDVLRAAERWEDLLVLDPADESAHLALMRAYADAGERRAALRQYERMERVLRRELGVAPSDEAVAIRDELLSSEAAAEAPGEHGLVGRAADLARLEGVLARLGTGDGEVVVISGPAGVGKSELLAWLRRRAADEGALLGSGVAASVEGAWPYAPVLEALADLARRDRSVLERLDDRFRAEVEAALAGDDRGWTGDTGHHRLFVAAAELLRTAAEAGPVLLVIDDVHEADEGSLRLLHYLGRTVVADGVGIVLAHRPVVVGEPLEDVRRSLLGRGAGTDVFLSPLDRDETRDLLEQYRPDVDDSLLEEIWGVSGGLPFTAIELARRSGAGGRVDARRGDVVATLAPGTRGVLQRVAVVGSSFDTDEFLALADLDEDEAFAQLDAALAARFVEPSDAGYRFRHQLLREALLEDLAPHRRREVHRVAARRLEELGSSPARIGHHLVAAGDLAAAVPYVVRAAETEAALGAFRDALDLLAPVVAHAEGDDLARLLSLRADLLAAVGDAGALRAYRQALDVAEGQRHRWLRARLARACVMLGDTEAAGEAIAGLEPDGGEADGAILLAQAMVAYFTGDLDAADRAVDEARQRVAQGEESWQMLDLVGLQGLLAHNRGEWFERLRLEMQTTRDAPDLATSVFDSHLCVAEYLLYGPIPYDEVLELAGNLRETAVRSGALRAVAFATAVVGEAAFLAGRLEDAERSLAEAVELHRDIGANAGEAHSLQRLAEVRLARGDVAEAERLLRAALPLARWSMLSLHLLQRIFGTMIAAAASPDAARDVVVQAEAILADEDTCPFCQVMFAVPASIACADVGDLDAAHLHLAVAERSASLWEGKAWEAAMFEARSHLSAAAGDPTEAGRQLEEAARLFELSGQPRDAERCRSHLLEGST